MKYMEEKVAGFRVFAKNILDEQIAELKNIDNSLLISGKLARFKVFNAHLLTLQQRLDEQISLILKDANRTDVSAELRSALNIASAEYINEYMCSSFLKAEA